MSGAIRNDSALPSRVPILGVGISVTSYAEVCAAVMRAAERRETMLITAADVNMLMQAWDDPAYAAVLNQFDIVTPDGQPVRWGMRWTRQASLESRVYGPTLMLDVCSEAARRDLSIFLYGSRGDVLTELAAKLGARFPGLRIAGTLPGRFRALSREEQTHDANAIVASGARILFVGMGCPRQEWWAFSMRKALTLPILTVGAAFDFHAGRVEQAPRWMQDRGLEWLFRLGREPKRLWRRYVLVTPRYLPLIAAQSLGLRRFPLRTELHDATSRACPG